jgi:hypothetical protein
MCLVSSRGGGVGLVVLSRWQARPPQRMIAACCL